MANLIRQGQAHLKGNQRQRRLYLMSPINAIVIHHCHLLCNKTLDLLQKYFSDSVYVNSCPLFPVPCSLFPTTAAKSLLGLSLIVPRRVKKRPIAFLSQYFLTN
ncbi:MAG: hypothetical protein F6K56_42210 [Moorea sp. SIO3G5]|nr:hypothetical protein [Moorena sp. SIO3G5]